MNGVKIKICGLFRTTDAQAVNAAMPDYAGFVFYEKSRRYITPEAAQALRTMLHRDIRTVGVLVNAPAEEIARLYEAGTISVVQLHGGEDNAFIAALRQRAPAMEIWQAFRIDTAASLQPAVRSAADLVLLDGGAGNGKVFPWQLAEGFPRPFLLAGGLTPETIPAAIRRLHPFGVDLSSGVETDGVKDAQKIYAAVSAARRATL